MAKSKGKTKVQEQREKKVKKSNKVVKNKKDNKDINNKEKQGKKVSLVSGKESTTTVKKDVKINTAKRKTGASKRRKKQLKVAFITPESLPLVKVGGLADVMGSLPKTLAKLGVQPIVILPEYRVIREGDWQIQDTGIRISSPVGFNWLEAMIDMVEIDSIRYYLVRYDPFFDRKGIYGEEEDYPDNLERFVFFSKIALELLKRIDFVPDIIHCNDWQTGLVPVFLRAFYGPDPFYSNTKVVFGLHNLAYQGLFSVDKFYLLGLDWSYFTYQGVEFYGKLNCLKSGLVYSDAIVTVSPRYAQEIQTPEYGWGLDGVLRAHKNKLYGILNGIDYEYWNPWTDNFIYEKFGARGNRVFLKGKLVNKTRLLEEEGLNVDPNTLVIGLVSRLVHQKGIDVGIEGVRPLLQRKKAYFIVLGKGEKQYEEALIDLSREFPDRVRVHLEFNEGLAHRIYAGSDVIIIPSRFEPCGLTQMIAMRYGCIPVARRTGGLADTISEKIGFLFDKLDGKELSSMLDYVLQVFADQDKWKERMKLAMKQDFSWERSAKAYKELFDKLKKGG